MATQGLDVQPILVVDRAKSVRYRNHLAAMLLKDLRSPGAHVAKSLRATMTLLQGCACMQRSIAEHKVSVDVTGNAIVHHAVLDRIALARALEIEGGGPPG